MSNFHFNKLAISVISSAEGLAYTAEREGDSKAESESMGEAGVR